MKKLKCFKDKKEKITPFLLSPSSSITPFKLISYSLHESKTQVRFLISSDVSLLGNTGL
jgi:hypothetical protein